MAAAASQRTLRISPPLALKRLHKHGGNKFRPQWVPCASKQRKRNKAYWSRAGRRLSSKNETPIACSASGRGSKPETLDIGQQHVGAMPSRSFPHANCTAFGRATERHIFRAGTSRAALGVKTFVIHRVAGGRTFFIAGGHPLPCSPLGPCRENRGVTGRN